MAIRDPESITVNENIPGNILQRLIDLENRFNDFQLLDNPTIEEVTDGRTGVFDLMISPAEGILVTDPTDVGYTGYFIAGNGLEFDGNNYVAGNVVLGEIKTGFTDAGTLYAIDAVIEGTVIIGPGSEAGGWLIDATRIYNNDIVLDSSIPAILIGDATAIMTGVGVFMGNDGGTYKLRIGDPADNYLLWDGTTLATAGQWIQSAGMNPALQEWQTNIVFSSASDVQVNWTSGTIVLSDGTTYSISSGNTGTMAALTYIYLDIAVSLTVLQTTTTYSTATGDGKILVAAAQNHTAGASVLPFGGQQPLINGGVQITALSILAGNIAAGAITATKISVTSLSAITATMGALTIDSLLTLSGASGAITIGTTPPSSATVGTGLWIDRTGVYSLSSNVQNATLTSAGLSAGAGAVAINSSGLAIQQASGSIPVDANSVKFLDGSTLRSSLFGYQNTIGLGVFPVTGHSGNIILNVDSPTGELSQILLQAYNDDDGLYNTVEVRTNGTDINADKWDFDLKIWPDRSYSTTVPIFQTDALNGNFIIGGYTHGLGITHWQPYAYPVGMSPIDTGINVNLQADGGTVVAPIYLPGPMLLESVSVWNTNTATARTWGWDLYRQRLNTGNSSENTLQRVAACSANQTFTPTVASLRTITAGSAPVFLEPGIYWIAIQCRHATNVFGLLRSNVNIFGLNTSQQKNTTNPNGATLDFVAATWTKRQEVPMCVLNGRVFGETTAF